MLLPLPTFIVAPDASGRGYEIEKNADLRGRWTVDLPMIMLAWSQTKDRQSFACSFDIGDDGLLVCRGQFVRRLSSGNSVAVLAGVVLSNEQHEAINWRTDLLAMSIPLQSEGSQFAKERHQFNLGPAREPANNWGAPALSWGRRFLELPQGVMPEMVLTKFFTAVSPPAQRGWFRCWSTTDALPAKGGFDLTSQAQLLMGPKSEQVPGGFLKATVERISPSGERDYLALNNVEESKLPASYQAHLDMLDLAAQVAHPPKAAVRTQWTIEFTEMPAIKVARRIALRIVGQVKLSQSLSLLQAMVVHKNPSVAQAGEAVSMKVLERLNENGIWGPDTLPLIERLTDKEPVYGLLLDQQGIQNHNSQLLDGLAKIETNNTARLSKTNAATGPNTTRFAVQFAKLAAQKVLPVDSALALVHSLTGDSDAGALRDVLTRQTIMAFADHDTYSMRQVAGALINAHFLNVADFRDINHAMARVGAAVAAIERWAD